MRSVRCLVLLMTVALPAVSRAEVESELVHKGVAAYEALDFEHAVDFLNRALAESLTREERIVTYRTLGFAYAALDRASDARTAFTHLLRLDGNAELDRTVAPRVRALFEEARALAATGRGEPTATQLPVLQPTVTPARPSEGQALSVSIAPPGGLVRSLHLFHRTRGASSFSEVTAPAPHGDRFELTVPGSAVHAPALEYYVMALGEDNVALARAGTLANPLRVDVTAREVATHKRGRAWVWGVAAGAVVVAGGAVVLAVLLTRTDSGSPADVTLIAPALR
jgi:tetratricopeptide (TPR) repeat protein